MDHSVVSKVLEESEILVEGILGKPSKEGFSDTIERADGNQLRYAKEANYEPVCIISPLVDDIEDGVTLAKPLSSVLYPDSRSRETVERVSGHLIPASSRK